MEMGDYETALQRAQKASTIYHQERDLFERQKREEADARYLCGEIFWKRGDHKAAINWAERARASYRELEQTEDEVLCLYVVAENAARLASQEGARVEDSQPPPRAARDALEKALKSAEAGLKLLRVSACVAHPELHGQLLCARAQVLTLKRMFVEALVSLDEAVVRFRNLEEYVLEADALLRACDNLYALRQLREASEAAEEALMLYQHCEDFEGEERAKEMLQKTTFVAARPAEAMPMPQAQAGPGVTPVWLQQADVAAEAAPAAAKVVVPTATGPALDMNAVTPEAVMSKVREIVAAVTATDQSEIDAETPLMEAGLTSSSAILLRDLLGKALPVSLPATLVFDYPTIADMTELVHQSTMAIKN
ncbi:HERC2 [Symbiodinium pilosum]|uniref:HERC2 protein n=1 Tax=Symbiodinium pilosum TaxID=2952 RepID=A0A812S985_SYMPI|nr:HERC2 [Symbiodinium pilosum]